MIPNIVPIAKRVVTLNDFCKKYDIASKPKNIAQAIVYTAWNIKGKK